MLKPLKCLIYNLKNIVFLLRIFGLTFQSKVAITPDLEVELTLITSKIPDKNFTTESCVTKLFFPILMNLKNFSSWILTENTVIDFFYQTRIDSSTKTCNKYCLSLVYNVNFLKWLIFLSFLSFAWKVLHQEICEWLGISFFVSQNDRYFSAFVEKLRISA